MLFAAQQFKNESWQIWEMNLDNLKCRKITSVEGNCTDPDYLPGSRLVFSKLTVNDTVKTAHCLYTCNSDGSDLRQITSVLKPALQLLYSKMAGYNGQQADSSHEGDPIFVVMRPDGTTADLFYRVRRQHLISSAHETSDGKIVFTESEKGNRQPGNLVSISYNRPLHSRINLGSETGVDFYNVLPLCPDNYLVSCRKTDSECFALYEFDPVKNHLDRKFI